MTNYFLALSQRTLGLSETLHPSIASMFEPGVALMDDYGWQEQTESEAIETDTIAEFSPVQYKQEHLDAPAQLPAEASNSDSQFFFRSFQPKISDVSSNAPSIASPFAENLYLSQRNEVRSFPSSIKVVPTQNLQGSFVRIDDRALPPNRFFSSQRDLNSWFSFSQQKRLGNRSGPSKISNAALINNNQINNNQAVLLPQWKSGLAVQSALGKVTVGSRFSDSFNPDSQLDPEGDFNEPFEIEPRSVKAIQSGQNTATSDDRQFQDLGTSTYSTETVEGLRLRSQFDDRTSATDSISEMADFDPIQDASVKETRNRVIAETARQASQPSLTASQKFSESQIFIESQHDRFVHQEQIPSLQAERMAVNPHKMDFEKPINTVSHASEISSQSHSFHNLEQAEATTGHSIHLVDIEPSFAPAEWSLPIQRFTGSHQQPTFAESATQPSSAVLFSPILSYPHNSPVENGSRQGLKPLRAPHRSTLEKTSNSTFNEPNLITPVSRTQVGYEVALSPIGIKNSLSNEIGLNASISQPILGSAESWSGQQELRATTLRNSELTCPRRILERHTPIVQLRSASASDSDEIDPSQRSIDSLSSFSSPTIYPKFASPSSAISGKGMDELIREITPDESIVPLVPKSHLEQQAIQNSPIESSGAQAQEQLMIQSSSTLLQNPGTKTANLVRTGSLYLPRSIEKREKITAINETAPRQQSIDAEIRSSSFSVITPSEISSDVSHPSNQSEKITVNSKQLIIKSSIPEAQLTSSNNRSGQFRDRTPASFNQDSVIASASPFTTKNSPKQSLELISQQLAPSERKQVNNPLLNSVNSNRSFSSSQVLEPELLETDQNRLQLVSEPAQSQLQSLRVSEAQFSEVLDDRAISDSNTNHDVVLSNRPQQIKLSEVQIQPSPSEDSEADSFPSRSTTNRVSSPPIQPPIPRTIVYLRPALKLDDYLKRRRGGRS